MSRNSAGKYSLPAGSTVTDGTTATASQHNTPIQDLEQDANTPRPVVAGGTGADNAAAARTNLGVGSASDVTFASVEVGDGTAAAPSYANTGDTDTGLMFPAADTLAVVTGGVERQRTDAGGRFVAGTTSTPAALYGANTAITGFGFDPSGYIALARDGISALFNRPTTDGDIMQFNRSGTREGWIGVGTAQMTIGAADTLIFGSNGVDKAQLTNSGNWLVGTTDSPGTIYSGTSTAAGFGYDASGYLAQRRNGSMQALNRTGTDGSVSQFYRDGTQVGSISVTTTATAYNTSSDYRLKENVVKLDGAIDRLAKIPVHRFNFTAEPSRTVDGFLAHEVQAHVPEAVTGQKDEVDENGVPVYQAIDQSKLVPLLAAALKEAVARIEALEAKVV